MHERPSRSTGGLPARRPPSRLLIAALSFVFLSSLSGEEPPFRPQTKIDVRNSFWHLNGEVTYEGEAAEGLLMNVRMVNSTFEDRNPKTRPKGFDPEKNTQAFLEALPDYVDHGVRAFTLCLQGGMPGYEGALNSAYEPDGRLRAEPLARVRKVIEACDRLGACVILGCFYQRQDQVLRDEAAVRRAVVETAEWIKERGYTNVLLEIANEYKHSGFDHRVIRDPVGCASLIELAKETHPGLLVAASGMGNGRLDYQVVNASDFLLLHFNSVPVNRIVRVVGSASKASKAIVCNEDDKTGEEAVSAMVTSVKNLCSWGYMNNDVNQYYPFEFRGAKDDPPVYEKLRELTGASRREAREARRRNVRPEVESVRRIWDRGAHNAFTDLARHRGRWICVFREGAAHVSPDGAVRVIASPDGESWESTAFLELSGRDLRDPKVVVDPRGRLMLLAGAAVRQGSERASEHRSVVSFSEDGSSWSPFREVGEKDMWLWRVTWHEGTAYGVGYGTRAPDGSRSEKRLTRLYRSRDGIEFETLVSVLQDADYPNETKLLFLEGARALCLMRRDGGGRSALLGESVAPYTSWSWKDLGKYLGGPNLIRLPDGRLLAAGRFLDGGAHTALARLHPGEGKLEKILRLPSGGDTSYPGLVYHDGRLWVSYYSSHEGKTSIYFARVRL